MSAAALPWTLLFASACALLQCALSALVIAQRMRARVLFLHGDNDTLLRRMRAHGNFTETVPMALLLMLLLELSGVATPWLLAMGTALLLGRVLHAAGVLRRGALGARRAGMALTVAVISLGGLACGVLAWVGVRAGAWPGV